MQIADLLKPIFRPISSILWFALGYAKICVLWVSVSWTNINIVGQGIQIFLNTLSKILDYQEKVLLHEKASFPFIWRLLYLHYFCLLSKNKQFFGKPPLAPCILYKIVTPSWTDSWAGLKVWMPWGLDLCWSVLSMTD